MPDCPLCGDPFSRRGLARHVHACLARVQSGWAPLDSSLRPLLLELALERSRSQHEQQQQQLPAGKLLLVSAATAGGAPLRASLGGEPLSTAGVAPVATYWGGAHLELRDGGGAGCARVPLAATLSAHALPHWRVRQHGAWGGLARAAREFEDTFSLMRLQLFFGSGGNNDDASGRRPRTPAGSPLPQAMQHDHGHLVTCDGPLVATRKRVVLRAAGSGGGDRASAPTQQPPPPPPPPFVQYALGLLPAGGSGGWLGARTMTLQLQQPPGGGVHDAAGGAASRRGAAATAPAAAAARAGPPAAMASRGGSGTSQPQRRVSWWTRLLDALRCARCDAESPSQPPSPVTAGGADDAATATGTPAIPDAAPDAACTLTAVYASLRDVCGPPGATPSLTPLHRAALDGQLHLLTALTVSCGPHYLLARTARADGGPRAPDRAAPPPGGVAFGHLSVLDCAILARQTAVVAALLRVQLPSPRLSMPARLHALHFAVLCGSTAILRAVVLACSQPGAFAAVRRRQLAVRRLGFAEGRACVDAAAMRGSPATAALLARAPRAQGQPPQHDGGEDEGLLLAAAGVAGDDALDDSAAQEQRLMDMVARWNAAELAAGTPPQQLPPPATALRRSAGRRRISVGDGIGWLLPSVPSPAAVNAALPLLGGASSAPPPQQQQQLLLLPAASSSPAEAVAFFIEQLASATVTPLTRSTPVSPAAAAASPPWRLGAPGGPASRDSTGSPLPLTTCLGPLPPGYRMPLDVYDALGRTPLAWAAILGSAPAVVLLLQRGCCAAPLDRAGCTPLHLALACGQPAIALQLLARVSPDAVAAAAAALPPSVGGGDSVDEEPGGVVALAADVVPPAHLPTMGSLRRMSGRAGSSGGSGGSATASLSPRSASSGWGGPDDDVDANDCALRPAASPAAAVPDETGRRLVTATLAPVSIVPNPLFAALPRAGGGGGTEAVVMPRDDAVVPSSSGARTPLRVDADDSELRALSPADVECTVDGGVLSDGPAGSTTLHVECTVEGAAAVDGATVGSTLPDEGPSRCHAGAYPGTSPRSGSSRPCGGGSACVSQCSCSGSPATGPAADGAWQRRLPFAVLASSMRVALHVRRAGRAEAPTSVAEAQAAAARCRPFSANNAGETPLLLAARAMAGVNARGAAAMLDVLQLLVELGAPRSVAARPSGAPFLPAPRTPLNAAFPYRALLDDVGGETPLHAAAKRGDVRAVRVLTLLAQPSHYAAVAALPLAVAVGAAPWTLLGGAPAASSLPPDAMRAVTSAAFAPVLAALGWLPMLGAAPHASVGRFCERLTVRERDGAGRTPLDCAREGREARARGGGATAAAGRSSDPSETEALLARLQAIEEWLFAPTVL